MATFDSQFYPYHKVYEGFYDLTSTEDIPRKIMDYLLDMPDSHGYMPVDDNERARVRLWKYLYHDGANPLEKELPTPEQKMNVLFDPDFPEKSRDKEKGYRLIPQMWIKPSQTKAQTRLYVYEGRPIAETDFSIQLSFVFDIWTHYTEESNTKVAEAYSRTVAMEQCIIEAFHGVSMAGVGAFYYNRGKHPDCGSRPLQDKDMNIGRRVIIGLEIKSETPNNPCLLDIPLGNGFMG